MTVYFPQTGLTVVVHSHRVGAVDLSKWITSFECSKSLGAPVGHATLALKVPARSELEATVDGMGDDDWVVVQRRCLGGQTRPSLYFVDTLIRHEQTVGEDGTPVREYSLVCSDEGKPFVTHQFRFVAGIPIPVPGILTVSPQAVIAAAGGASADPGERLAALFRIVFRPARVQKTKRWVDRPAPDKAAAVPGKAPAKPKGQAPLAEGQLTANFRLREFIRSKPTTDVPPDVFANLKQLATALQTLRDNYFNGQPVTITPAGGYAARYDDGKPTASQHWLGKAADFTVAGMSPVEVVQGIRDAIEAKAVPWGGLGLYATYVHYDIRDQPVERLWYGTAEDKPTDEQIAALPQAWKPSWAADGVQFSEPVDENEDAHTPVPTPTVQTQIDAVEMLPGGSGDGAYVAPQSLAMTPHPGAAQALSRHDWVDVVDFETENNPDLRVAGRWWQLLSLFQTQSNTFDGLVRGQTDPGFNELFYDMRPRPPEDPLDRRSSIAGALGGWRPCLIFRRRPLDPVDWKALPVTVVPPGLQQHVTRSKTGTDRATMVMALPFGAIEGAGGALDWIFGAGEGRIPGLDLQQVRRHGLRALTIEHAFAAPQSEAPSYVTQIQRANRSVYGWHDPTPDLHSEEVQIPALLAGALVGYRLRYVDADGLKREGYIEGVRESVKWSADGTPGAMTVVTVTRVHNPDNGYPYPEAPSWRYQ